MTHSEPVEGRTGASLIPFAVDNCSRLDVFRIEGRICKTNTVSNTAFRGFGGPQGMMMHSAIMCAVADKLGMRLDEVMGRNLYKEGERTHFGQPLVDWNVPAMIDQIRQSAELDTRRAAVEQFNAQHKWKKRGMALIPTKFGEYRRRWLDIVDLCFLFSFRH